MAERRMFAKTIVLSDAFLDMPLSARCLYFTLGMFADDDGFVNSPKAIMRQCGASVDDMNILLSKKFVLSFDSGVIVIKHWRINNYLRNDRYTETKYQEEKAMLSTNDNGAYTMRFAEANVGIPNSGIPSIGKDSIDKDSLVKDIMSDSASEIIAYLNEKLGTKFKASADKTKRCIHARLEEGFTIDDFKTVIDKKCDEWLGTEMQQYLRPETLFGTKFEGYLNARIIKKQVKPSSVTASCNDYKVDYASTVEALKNAYLID